MYLTPRWKMSSCTCHVLDIRHMSVLMLWDWNMYVLVVALHCQVYHLAHPELHREECANIIQSFNVFAIVRSDFNTSCHCETTSLQQPFGQHAGGLKVRIGSRSSCYPLVHGLGWSWWIKMWPLFRWPRRGFATCWCLSWAYLLETISLEAKKAAKKRRKVGG